MNLGWEIKIRIVVPLAFAVFSIYSVFCPCLVLRENALMVDRIRKRLGIKVHQE
jgi:hypothetical protein